MSTKILLIGEKYKDYLKDEAKFHGNAQTISFPENVNEIKLILKILGKKSTLITIQGGKTSITGSAIPLSGHILNLSKMNHVLSYNHEAHTITVEPGINLIDLQQKINEIFPLENLFWPVQPTETSATVGGVIATNAQGLMADYYGDNKKYIDEITLMDYAGNVQVISSIKGKIVFEDKKYNYLDAVLGREGVTGIVTEARLKLVAKPEKIWGLVFFFEDKNPLIEFIETLQNNNYHKNNTRISVMEYIDNNSIKLVQSRKNVMEKIRSLPDIDDKYSDIVYLEIAGKEVDIEEIAGNLLEAAEIVGCDTDVIWALSEDRELEKMRAFRHAISECINYKVEQSQAKEQSITKLGTDMSFPVNKFRDIFNHYLEIQKQCSLTTYLFGHLQHNHLHFNLVVTNKEEYEKGISIIQQLADFCLENHGCLFTEHGIGKLKAKLLKDKIDKNYIKFCEYLKEQFHTEDNFNKNNIKYVDQL